MSDYSTPLPSRRAQREAREAAERIVSSVSRVDVPDFTLSSAAVTALPSRRARRQAAVGTPNSTESTSDSAGLPSQTPVLTPTVGRSQSTATSLHVERFPTGEISGPIDNTGEIILTGPIEIPMNATAAAARAVVVPANLDVDAPGIPRRATEALSIIGRAAPMDETRRIPSVGGGISSGFATFMGLLVLTLIGLAFYTDLI